MTTYDFLKICMWRKPKREDCDEREGNRKRPSEKQAS